jgi:hypothetical protein
MNTLKKLLATVALIGALAAPANADSKVADDSYISCLPKHDGTPPLVFNSPNSNKPNKRWSKPVEPSWVFLVKRALDEIHFQGDLFGTRDGITNVWIRSTDWNCETHRKGEG